MPGSGSVSVAISPFGGIDVPGLLLALDRYPVGCSEQIVSRALPLLYLSKLAPAQDLGLDPDLPGRINTAIATLMSRQTSTGAFGLWSADADNTGIWLDSYVTDFLTRAREQGFSVPQASLDQALDQLRNFVANSGDAKDEDALSLAYAIYVLARNGRPVLGDLHYLAGSRLSAFSTPMAQAQIGAGLALLGDRARGGGGGGGGPGPPAAAGGRPPPRSCRARSSRPIRRAPRTRRGWCWPRRRSTSRARTSRRRSMARLIRARSTGRSAAASSA